MSPARASNSKHCLVISRAVEGWAKNLDSFSHYGFMVAQHQRTTDFFLLRGDGSGLRFSIVMVDLAERVEVGVLNIESAERNYFPKELFALPLKFQQRLSPERLVLETDYGSIDSGLVLTASDDDQLVLVSGVYPYTIEVRAPFSEGRFEPEYSLDKYLRQPIAG